jgi:hypothetical protein
MHWVTIDALREHWKRARIIAKRYARSVDVRTENIDAFSLTDEPGWSPFRLGVVDSVDFNIDGVRLSVPGPRSDRSWHREFHREGDVWALGSLPDAGLRKRHDLQGPIDDAFMDSFVFVRPTGKGGNATLDSWVKQESDRAVEHWRRQFRGQARVLDDSSVGDAVIASANLVLWGDPQSNSVLRRIADRLPISWDARAIKVGDREFAAENHALIMVYPNPLNPRRYVVLNSGFTYRDYDYLNNARQVPKLPDWAVIDLRTPPDSLRPGAVVAADFFGERWEVRPKSPDR